jgi:hypothetical protein
MIYSGLNHGFFHVGTHRILKITFVAPLQIITTRLQESPFRPTIDYAMIILGGVLLDNEHKVLFD